MGFGRQSAGLMGVAGLKGADLTGAGLLDAEEIVGMNGVLQVDAVMTVAERTGAGWTGAVVLGLRQGLGCRRV